MKIKQATTSDEMDAIRSLFHEYERFINIDLSFQDFGHELEALPGKYAPPEGALLIAINEDKTVGCVAVRKLDADICEMKRLYVRPEAKGIGLGKRLAREIIDRSRELGYAVMRLDTLESFTEAMGLYESLGFDRIEPYYDNPLPDAVYWELKLK